MALQKIALASARAGRHYFMQQMQKTRRLRRVLEFLSLRGLSIGVILMISQVRDLVNQSLGTVAKSVFVAFADRLAVEFGVV